MGWVPAARAEPPWQSAQRMQDLVFEAQTALLLDQGRSPDELVRRARALFRGPLARGLRRDAPAAGREVRAALSAAERAAAGRDQALLGAALGRLRAALFAGSYRVTVEAVGAANPERASTWLLLREFRKATRFTRPGVDATVAVRALGRGRIEPRRAQLEVRKDLLDAYQAALIDRISDADKAAERGFGPAWAEAGAMAAGLWPILAPEYARARGERDARQAERALGRLADSARAADRNAFAAARADVGRALDAFTAAPFTAAEQARRAAQLVRFLDLVPIEYDRGTEDGRVTVDFEVQEAVAFQEGTVSAFSDLEGELSKRDPEASAKVERALRTLGRYVTRAQEGGPVASQEQLEATHDRAADTLEELIPEEWELDDSQSDFDLIALTLDRLDAAVGAGRYAEAEQTRLEAYAFFEFGPELSLRSLAPDVTARVEGLIWFGAEGEEGLAKLIANKKPRRDFQATRLALDEALTDGAGALGEGASGATVVTNAAVIVFREGLEAVLILAAVMASLRGGALAQRRPMMIGAVLAIFASIVTYILARTVLTELARYGEKLEAIVGLVAVAVLLLVLNWFFHRVYWTDHIKKFNRRRRRLLTVAGGGLVSAQVLGFVLLGFSTIYREGFETVLFLQALELNSGLAIVVEGVLLGGIAVGAVAIATFKLERKLPYKKMLIVTGVLLTLVLAVMVGKTVRTMQGVGWLPITPIDVELPYWTGIWLGVFPTVETLVAQAGAVIFVIGSYFAAERLKHRSPRRAAPAPATVRAAHAGRLDSRRTGLQGD
jgi:high-affinity iron transporter